MAPRPPNAAGRPVRLDESAKLIAAAACRMAGSREDVAWSITRLLSSRARTGRATPEDQNALPLFLRLLARPCALDLVLFFHRHPHAMLTLDDLVARVGYAAEDIQASLEVLQRAGLLTWSKSVVEEVPARARLYQFTSEAWHWVLPPFVWLASTGDGRRVLRRVLSEYSRRPRTSSNPEASAANDPEGG